METYNLPIIKLTLHIREPMGYLPTVLRTPESALGFLKPLQESPNEQFICMHLNVRNEIIGLQVVSEGTISSSLVHPREVFKAAILNNASGVVFAHNHPGGSQIFSEDDIKTTKQLLLAANILGITVLDHVLITPQGSITSMKEYHPELWS